MKTYQLKLSIIHIILLLFPVLLMAQTDTATVEKETFLWSYKKEVAFNLTNLAQRFVPLNLQTFSTQPVAIKAKFYGRKFGFRMDLGADVSRNANPTINRSSFHLSLGIERKKPVWKEKWAYTTGWMLTVEQRQDSGIAGIQKFFGLEYNINPNVQINTETGIIVGNIFDDFGILFNPPTSLYLQVRF